VEFWIFSGWFSILQRVVLKKIQAKFKRIESNLKNIHGDLQIHVAFYLFLLFSYWLMSRALPTILMLNGSTGRSEIECKPNLKNSHTYLKIIQSVLGVLENELSLLHAGRLLVVFMHVT
jgi:hypothetical protein